jgi:hypothetical protein
MGVHFEEAFDVKTRDLRTANRRRWPVDGRVAARRGFGEHGIEFGGVTGAHAAGQHRRQHDERDDDQPGETVGQVSGRRPGEIPPCHPVAGTGIVYGNRTIRRFLSHGPPLSGPSGGARSPRGASMSVLAALTSVDVSGA